jgi:hypothetical protein
VERAYGEVKLPRKQTEAVREKLGQAVAGMRRQAEAEAARQRKRLAKLTEERGKLLHAYYAGAVPVDRWERAGPAERRGQPGRAPP